MTQAIDIIRDALEQLRVADSNAPLDVNDAETARRALNAMLRAWEANGLNLAWSDIARIDDAMPTPPEADEAIGANLAVRLAAKYGVNVAPGTTALASEGVALLRAISARTDYARTQYDDLPRGTGQRMGSPRRFFNT